MVSRTVAENTKLPHIREFLVAEIIARSARKCMDKELTHMIYRLGDRTKHADVTGWTQGTLMEIKDSFLREFSSDLKQVTLTILNLIMAKSEDSDRFWDKMLKPQIYADYRFKFPKNWTFDDLPGGCLVHACSHHLNLTLNDRTYLVGGQHPVFTTGDIISFKVRTICPKFQKHRIRSLLSHYEDHIKCGNYQEAIILLGTKLSIENSLMSDQDYLDTLAELADLYLTKGDYLMAVKTCLKSRNKMATHSPTYEKLTQQHQVHVHYAEVLHQVEGRREDPRDVPGGHRTDHLQLRHVPSAAR